MGLSKRISEMLIQALGQLIKEQGGSPTVFSIVRFGNVLGSSGSVVPIFREQIRTGGPITLTHPEVTRFFMTISEAVQLVIQSSAMASGGEIFLLDMGASVRIQDLARKMVYLSGLMIRDEINPSGDIEIKITGLRPGEKLYEELLIDAKSLPTSHPRILSAFENFMHWSLFEGQLNKLIAALESSDLTSLLGTAKELVPEYVPSSNFMTEID
jgi:FlaA1/EpsC-like NDP-sugar epimerase